MPFLFTFDLKKNWAVNNLVGIIFLLLDGPTNTEQSCLYMAKPMV